MATNDISSMLKKVLNTEWNDIPERVVIRSKWVLLDTLLVMLYGIKNNEESISFLNKNCISSKDNVKKVRVPDTNFYLSKSDAAILFGSSVVSFELDEGSQYAKGHPGAHIVPALLIESFQHKISGEKFLKALILGYEISCRIAYASKMRDDMHPHGTWGIGGAVAAIGILEDVTQNELIDRIMLALTLPIATSWESAVDGLSVRNLYCGLGILTSLQVGRLSRAGFKSSEDNVKNIWANIVSSGIDESLLSKNIHDDFMINNNYFKLYPACRFSHSAITALLNIKKHQKIDPQKIKKIVVKTYSLSSRLRDTNPKTYLAAKFSIPFLFSLILNDYSLFNANNDVVFSDLKIRNLSKKIAVISDEHMDQFLPYKRPSFVKVIMNYEEEYEEYVDDAPSGYDEKKQNQYLLQEKYSMMFPNIIDRGKILKLTDRIFKIDQLEDVYKSVVSLW